MPEDPELPDLKKEAERKAAAFTWSDGGGISKAASSVRFNPPPPKPGLLQGKNRLAVFGGLLLAGGLVFSLAALKFTDAVPSLGMPGMSGAKSTLKVRFASRTDPTRNVVPERSAPAADGKMRFDLIQGAPPGTAGDGTGTDGVQGTGAGGEAPMNYDEDGTSHGAGGASASAAAAGKDGGAGGSAPHLSSSFSGAVKFRGMKRVSPNAGFRAIGRPGIADRNSRSPGAGAMAVGSAANHSGSAGAAGSGGSRAATGSAGLNSGAPAGGGADAGATAAGGGGGGGGGGGAGGTPNVPDGVDQKTNEIENLMNQAAAKRDDAEREKKRAEFLKLGGQDIQAAYHYDRYLKFKDQSDELAQQAQRKTAALSAETNAALQNPAPAPAASAPATAR